MELVVFISFRNGFQHLFQSEQSPFVDFRHILIRNGIRFRIKIINITEKEAECITNFTIYITKLFQNFRRESYIALIVGRGYPKAHNISTVLVDNFLRSYGITHGFTHLTTFTVNGKAVRQNGLIRSDAVSCYRCEQGRVKPTAMLVRSFQVHVGRICQFGIMAQYALVRTTAVKPDVHNIRFFTEFRTTALRAFKAFGK